MHQHTELIHKAALLCELVCAHYGMSEAATKQAVASAKIAPHHAKECYGAILTSLFIPQ